MDLKQVICLTSEFLQAYRDNLLQDVSDEPTEPIKREPTPYMFAFMGMPGDKLSISAENIEFPMEMEKAVKRLQEIKDGII